jgi:hypothetical protein
LSSWLPSSASEYPLFLAPLAILLIVTEVAFRLGRRRRSLEDEHSKSQIVAIQGSLLGLLALLLAFTFSMAVSRYDARRQLVVAEANAIGTAVLRAQLLQEPQRKEVTDLLRHYVDLRLEAAHEETDRTRVREIPRESEQVRDQLWQRAVAVAGADRHDVMAALFVGSMNEVMDVDSMLVAAIRSHVPDVVLMLVYGVAVFGLGAVGYGCGLGNERHAVSTTALSIVIAAVVAVIVDLDRPWRGNIRVSALPILELREQLRTPPAAP